MADLNLQIQSNLGDIYRYSNVLPKYSDAGLSCYGLLINSTLFHNLTSLFYLSTPARVEVEEKYMVDDISEQFYKTPFLWPILLLLSGNFSVDTLSDNNTFYLPPDEQLKTYFSEAMTSTIDTPVLNEPDLSTINASLNVARIQELSTTWITNLVTEVLGT